MFATAVQATVPSRASPDRTSDLLAGIEQTRGHAGVLLAYVGEGDEG